MNLVVAHLSKLIWSIVEIASLFHQSSQIFFLHSCCCTFIKIGSNYCTHYVNTSCFHFSIVICLISPSKSWFSSLSAMNLVFKHLSPKRMDQLSFWLIVANATLKPRFRNTLPWPTLIPRIKSQQRSQTERTSLYSNRIKGSNLTSNDRGRKTNYNVYATKVRRKSSRRLYNMQEKW